MHDTLNPRRNKDPKDGKEDFIILSFTGYSNYENFHLNFLLFLKHFGIGFVVGTHIAISNTILFFFV